MRAWRVACLGGRSGLPPAGHRGLAMSAEDDRAFHLERAEQCRRMAADAGDPAVRNLHEQLAEFHEAEARRAEMPAPAKEQLT